MPKTDRARLLALVRRRGTITAAEAARVGIHSQHLTRLVAGAVLERVARGQYRVAGRPITEHHSLSVAARSVPNGVICLLSALSFHEIGTELPADVWVAIERRARVPSPQALPLRVVRYSGDAFTEGIEVHRIEGQSVRIYGVAKTLADLFKHRNKVGLDVAIEALREGWRERRFTIEALERSARACRVARVMSPYIEAVIA